ncbi:MAG: c-type cytochrome biogenesis protein CcsB [Fibrobacterota bacterium]
MDITLFWISFIAYFTATLLHILFLSLKSNRLSVGATVFMGLGFLMQTAAMIARTKISGHLPLTNMFEYVTVLAWFAGGAYLVSAWKLKLRILEAVTGPVIFMLYVSASLLPKQAESQLMPALQSVWLQIHVSLAAFGEAVFLVAFVASLLYLIKARTAPVVPGSFRDRLPSADTLDELTYRCVMIAYPLFTIGALFAGAVWAYKAWGNFWSWDPKETCSLIVWLVYSAYLHARLVKGWRGKKCAVLNIVGFVWTLFTLFSNLILGGLHAYGV